MTSGAAAFGLLAQAAAAWLVVRAAIGARQPLLRWPCWWLTFATLASLVAFAGMASGLYVRGLSWLLPLAVLLASVPLVRRPAPAPPAAARGDRPPLPPRTLAWAARIGIGVALIGAVLEANQHPEGDVDAWAMWNTKAALLAAHGADWPTAVTLLHGHYHPDYPLLLPAFHAEWLRVTGGPSPLVQAALGFGFALSGIALLAGLLGRCRGAGWAWLGALVLGVTPWYWSVAVGQLADVPLGACALAGLGLLLLALREATPPPGLAVLAGALAAATAWTKNEGLLFLLALGLASLLPLRALGLARWGRLALPFAAGAAPVLAVTLWFKATIAVDNDLVAAAADGGLGALLFDPGRWIAVAAYAFAELSKLGNGLFWVVVIAVLASRWRAPHSPSDALLRSGTTWITVTMALWFAGYLLVYVVTPHDLQWHLSTSLRRLLVQMWMPGVLALLLLARGEVRGVRGAPAP